MTRSGRRRSGVRHPLRHRCERRRLAHRPCGVTASVRAELPPRASEIRGDRGLPGGHVPLRARPERRGPTGARAGAGATPACLRDRDRPVGDRVRRWRRGIHRVRAPPRPHPGKRRILAYAGPCRELVGPHHQRTRERSSPGRRSPRPRPRGQNRRGPRRRRARRRGRPPICAAPQQRTLYISHVACNFRERRRAPS